MRSIFVKTVVCCVATLFLAAVGFGLTVAALRPRSPLAVMGAMVDVILEDTQRAANECELEARLAQLHENLPGRHYLTDAAGVDLVTGEDRAALLESAQETSFPPPGAIARRSRDGKMWLILTPPPRRDALQLLPSFAWLLLLVALPCVGLALHFALPLARLRRVVERFGRGELSARIAATRKDEIGELGRAFDRMADQIEALRAAERRLLRDVSHELRSPLTRLGFAVELARSSADPDQALDRVSQEARRLNSLIDQLLTLSRADIGAESPELADVRLDELLGELSEAASLEAAARGCRLDLRVEGGVALRGERELLHRAIDNVVRNAIRHSPEGESVELGLDLRGETARLWVRDFGPGVPEAALGEIFKPFYRVEADRARKSGGVGLGLAIAQRAVLLHAGWIEAFNARPGLLVELTLPGARRP